MDKNKLTFLYIPTYGCNLNCSYCYLGKEKDREIANIKYDALSLAAYAENENLDYKIYLHGGEFTICPIDDIKYFVEVLKPYSLFAFQTNGFHLSKEYKDWFIKIYNDKSYNLEPFSVTIDFPKTVHNKYRNKSYDAILNNLKDLKNGGVKIHLITGLYNDCVNDLDAYKNDLLNMINALDIKTLKLNFIADENIVITSENQLKFFNFLKDNDLLKYFYGDAASSELFKKRFENICSSQPSCLFFTYYKGQFKNCHRLFGMAQSEPKPVIKDVHGDCAQCKYLSFCQGGCLADKLDMKADKNPFCILTYKVLEYYLGEEV